MADTSTTHLNLIKQDPNAAPDIDKEHSNLDTLDTEVWARGKTFNGETVGSDGGFHVRSIPYAENLETGSSQKSDDTYIIRTSGGDASINDGDAWLMTLKGTRVHTGYTAQNVSMTVTPMTRTPDPAITATLDEETFEAYVSDAGTYTVTYDGEAWDTSPTLYGLTISNTPISGDSITMVWDGENDATVTVNAATRPTPESITATIDEDTFIAYVSSASGTVTLTYSTQWSADPANYGITVTGTPIAGDVITVTYVKEVRGTITQSNPQVFVSTGWNLYNHTNEYAKIIKYSDSYAFKIGGTYTGLSFAYNLTDEPDAITPVSGGFNPFDNDDPIGTVGYVFVTGGNATDTQIWMTWSDWGTQANSGTFEAYSQTTVDLTTFMGSNFPYGLMQVGNIQDEINLNVGIATSYVERQAYNSTNLAAAKASGRAYEYDENYIYIERATSVQYMTTVEGDYTASDHGLEMFTGTTVDVYAQTIYGANLKNKLERDVLTISQQTLTSAQQSQVRTNISAASKDEVKPITITIDPVTNANGNYSHTTSDDRISEDMKAIAIDVGTPETFLAPIKVTTGAHTVTLACTNAVGSSTVVVTFIRTQPLDVGASTPTVTSTEFDILSGRIGSLSSLTTTAKTSAVAAINELNGNIATIASHDNYTQSLVVASNASTTSAQFSTYNGRKFSDYRLLVFVMYESKTASAVIRETVVIPSTMWTTGKSIYLVQNHGGTNLPNVSGIVISYNSDTSVNALANGAGALIGFEIQGYLKS